MCVVLLASVQALEKVAVCKIDKSSGSDDQEIEGIVTFKENADGTGDTTIKVDLSGFSTADEFNEHGFHIHEKGDLGDECNNAGAHYNPDGVDHAGPTDSVRHVGDLGNVVETDEGKVVTDMADSVVTLSGERSVIGKAIVVHEKKDDLGKGVGDLEEESKKTGNAGKRIACCKIEEVAMVTATCTIEAESGDSNIPVKGTVKLGQREDGEGETTIDIDLTGFTKNGKHGFHIHQEGDLGDKCNNAKGHYNPFNKTHGAPTDEDRHVGDLGNIDVAENKHKRTITDTQVKLVGDQKVIGRAIVVHANEDDLGTGTDDSLVTGNAGPRIACCVIKEDSSDTGGATALHLQPVFFGLLALLYALLKL